MATKKERKKKTARTIQIKYVRSAIGAPAKHKLVVKSLGFKRLNQIVTREDSPAVRGMVAQIPHLVTILETR